MPAGLPKHGLPILGFKKPCQAGVVEEVLVQGGQCGGEAFPISALMPTGNYYYYW